MNDHIAVALDLDGTLLALSSAGSRAMYRALRDVLGLDRLPAKVRFSGRTDRAIAQELFERERPGRAPSEDDLATFFERYLHLLPEEIQRSPYGPTPGAGALIRALDAEPALLVGVATGNLERAAAQKLASAGLDLDADFAAWGDETAAREELVELAFARADALAHPHRPDRWVIGDTPRDVAAAHDAGARCVAVACGPYSIADLLETGAELVVETPAEALSRRFWAR